MKIVAISDQHGFFPDIPECDLLIVSGDLCLDVFWEKEGIGRTKYIAKYFPEYQYSWWLKNWLAWRHKQPAKMCIATWGNHDFCGEIHPEYSDDTTIMTVDNELTYQGLRIWVSPWSNNFMDWAFMKSPEEMKAHYAKIPEGIDILVSHQPPIETNTTIWDFGTNKRQDIGSKELAETIDRIKPKLVFCGHIHVAQGKYDRGTTTIYNTSVVNEQYKMVHEPTEVLFTK